MQKNKILVTGASGFIGSHLVYKLVSSGHKPTLILRKTSNTWRIKDFIDKVDIIYADLGNKSQIKKIVKKIKPDTIFHLASYGVVSGQVDSDKIKKINFEVTINLLDACTETGFKHFVHTGSCFEYGSSTERITEDSVLKPETDYAVFKAASSLYCLKQALANKLPITIIRPFTAYGPGEEKARLIPTLMLSALNNTRPGLSSPNPVRNFIHVDDLARAYLAVMNKPSTFGQIYNVGSNQDYSIGKIVKKIEKISKQKINPIYNKKLIRSYESTVWKTSYAKINKTVGWKPKYSLEQGLNETYKWFINNHSLYR